MGQVLKILALREIPDKCIFSKRFVVELCEKVHFHYRNLRLNLSLRDWLEICQGLTASCQRWQKLGSPQEGDKHIELCRRRVGNDIHNDGIKISLNGNLYLKNKGKIYSEGSDFKEDKYIHLKIRDIRLEMPISEFKELANAIKEAEKGLENGGIGALL